MKIICYFDDLGFLCINFTRIYFPFADIRGFMTHKGIPDNPRAARIILKDFVNGKLLFCCAPPGISQVDFHTFPPRQRQLRSSETPQGAKIMRVCHISFHIAFGDPSRI